MVGEADLFLGFDPGGTNKFGVALLSGAKLSLSVCSGIGEAVSWALAECQGITPAAAGIDTLLHWSKSPASLRSSDKWLRANYPDAAKSIISPNALYGAMVIGGMGLALELRRVWPSILLNETHPKIFYREIAGSRYVASEIGVAAQVFARHSKVDCTNVIENEHAFDALLSAWATREGYSQSWPDLVGLDHDNLFPAGKVNYLWPVPIRPGGPTAS